MVGPDVSVIQRFSRQLTVYHTISPYIIAVIWRIQTLLPRYKDWLRRALYLWGSSILELIVWKIRLIFSDFEQKHKANTLCFCSKSENFDFVQKWALPVRWGPYITPGWNSRPRALSIVATPPHLVVKFDCKRGSAAVCASGKTKAPPLFIP